MIDLLQCSLGMELGSTRIKAVLIDASHTPLAQGDFTWENRLQNGIWTYPMEEVRQGVQAAYAALAADVQAKHGMALLARVPPAPQGRRNPGRLPADPRVCQSFRRNRYPLPCR